MGIVKFYYYYICTNIYNKWVKQVLRKRDKFYPLTDLESDIISDVDKCRSLLVLGKIDCDCNNNFENYNFHLPLEIFILSPFILLSLFKKANMLRLLSSIIFKLEPFAMFERPLRVSKNLLI